MRALPLLSLLLTAALVLASCATTSGTGPPPPTSLQGKPLPVDGLQTPAGEPVGPAALAGRVVLVDLWATWCEPCKESLPRYDAMARELAAKGLTVVAVSVDQEREPLDAWLAGPGAELALTVAWDPEGRVPERLGVRTMPTAFVVDRAGIVRLVHEGFEEGDFDLIRRTIDGLLAGP